MNVPLLWWEREGPLNLPKVTSFSRTEYFLNFFFFFHTKLKKGHGRTLPFLLKRVS